MNTKVFQVLAGVLALIISASVVRGADVRYEARWDSLDRRPCPEWFLDAKFGIFIHCL